MGLRGRSFRSEYNEKILVTGAGGFIGHHLVKFLKREGLWVRGADLKYPEFGKTDADEFKLLDLRETTNCFEAIKGGIDTVYHLAADMGGMGFIHSSACDIMRNSGMMNSNMIDAAAKGGIENFFFSSFVCIYRNMKIGEPEMTEEQAYPAMLDNDYGWEKLYAERTNQAYGCRYGMRIRIVRIQNCYGPEGTWQSGREEAPAALCRKIAEAENGGTIEVWGNGSAVRSYTYVEDMVDGIYRLMQSDLQEPADIGNPEYASVNQLVDIICKVSGKKVSIKYYRMSRGCFIEKFQQRANLQDWLESAI